MRLLMISGDRSILQGKKGAFFYTLQEFSKHWERIDVICPRSAPITQSLPPRGEGESAFQNVFFHPSPRGLWYQPWWILQKGSELIRTYRHDVMTVHEYPPFYNGIGAKKLHKNTGIPYALEIHHILGWPRAGSFFEVIGRILSRKFLWIDAWHAASVRTVNADTKERLALWGVSRDKIHVVPSFYLDRSLLRPDPGAHKTYDAVCSARLVPNKGLFEVIDAVALLPGITLCIIGDGPLRSTLESHARKIRNRITFTGWLNSQEEVLRTIQSGHVFVMNSKSEGGPRSALEAMALGMPVIATKVGVMPEVIVDGQNGVFTPGTAKDLSEKLHRLLSNTGERERIGREAKKIVDQFEKIALIKDYAQFLQSIPTR
ncbi:glycosyltransferase [Candidatus Peregrinibacteria bacterium]|nr:glycosyltransferase [Candidatus Peregrinibacteria bacterium]